MTGAGRMTRRGYPPLRFVTVKLTEDERDAVCAVAEYGSLTAPKNYTAEAGIAKLRRARVETWRPR